MVFPETQPIAIGDVIVYLDGELDLAKGMEKISAAALVKTDCIPTVIRRALES